MKLNQLALDRLYVANRGLINPTERRCVIEKPNSGVALMNLCMHTLNFLLREVEEENLLLTSNTQAD
jgi:hypothetical protein